MESGWNYWIDQYQHKHSVAGSETIQAFDRGAPNPNVCVHGLYGAWISWYWTAGEAGCAGYNKNSLTYSYGGSSYTYIDSYA